MGLVRVIPQRETLLWGQKGSAGFSKACVALLELVLAVLTTFLGCKPDFQASFLGCKPDFQASFLVTRPGDELAAITQLLAASGLLSHPSTASVDIRLPVRS